MMYFYAKNSEPTFRTLSTAFASELCDTRSLGKTAINDAVANITNLAKTLSQLPISELQTSRMHQVPESGR